MWTKERKMYTEKIQIKKKKLIPIYHQALQHSKLLPRCLTHNLPPPISSVQKAPVSSFVYLLKSYHALQQRHLVDGNQARPTNKELTQLYFTKEGSLTKLHI